MEFKLPDPGDSPNLDMLASMKAMLESYERLESAAITTEALHVKWLKANAMLQYIALATDERVVRQKIMDALATTAPDAFL